MIFFKIIRSYKTIIFIKRVLRGLPVVHRVGTFPQGFPKPHSFSGGRMLTFASPPRFPSSYLA